MRLVGKDDELLVIVDTAFTGELLLSRDDAMQWGVLLLDVESSLELGDRSTLTAKQGLVSIDWLGSHVDATVQVTPDLAGRPRREAEPAGLLGAGLLAAVRMTIDYPQRTVALRVVDWFRTACPDDQVVRGSRPYSCILRYSVDRPMPSRLATSVM